MSLTDHETDNFASFDADENTPANVESDSEIEVISDDASSNTQPMNLPEFLPSYLSLAPVQPLVANYMPRKEEPIHLPESATLDIFNILTGAFFEQAGVPLTQREEERFRAEAERARVELEQSDGVNVELENVLNTYYFHTVILKQTILALQDIRAMQSELSFHSVLERETLPHDMYFLPDMTRQRLLLAQNRADGNFFWQINIGQLQDWRSPRQVTWLNNMHFLVCDSQSRGIAEIGLNGQVYWQFDSNKSPDHALRNPVKATCFLDIDGKTHYLIVDQAQHRILEVLEDQSIVWQYGVAGQSRDLENYLNHPTDVQYTSQRSYLIADSGNHRVLEVKKGQVINNFNESDGLEWPVYAERLGNGHTLILDQAQYCVTVFDANHKKIQQCHYYRTGMDERYKTHKITKVLRRSNQNLLIMDQDKILELDYSNQKIVWFSTIKHLQNTIQTAVELKTESSNHILGKAFDRYEATTSAPEIITLRQMIMNVPLFDGMPAPVFYDQIEKLLKFRDFQPQSFIVEKGKPLKSMYFIQNGTVEILGEKEGEAVIEMKAGESFGMMGIVFVEPRQSSIRAKSYCGIYELEKKSFDKLLDLYPELEAKINKLAAERLIVAKMKQGQSSEKTQSRFQEVLAMQKARFANATSHVSQTDKPVASVKPGTISPSFRSHRPVYNDAEKHLIQEAINQGQQCLEVHVFIHRTSMMKGARAFLVIMVLEKLGTILHSTPTLEEIQGEKAVAAEVVVTLATHTAVDQVIEDATMLAEIDKVDVIPLELDSLA